MDDVVVEPTVEGGVTLTVMPVILVAAVQVKELRFTAVDDGVVVPNVIVNGFDVVVLVVTLLVRSNVPIRLRKLEDGAVTVVVAVPVAVADIAPSE